MSLYTAERKQESAHEELSEEELMKAVDGNLCRCTGYRSIIDAAKIALVKTQTDHSVGATDCDHSISDKKHSGCETEASTGTCSGNCGKCSKANVLEEIEDLANNQIKIFKGKKATWYHPKTLDQLLSIKVYKILI